jgi:hypothetical protein
MGLFEKFQRRSVLSRMLVFMTIMELG